MNNFENDAQTRSAFNPAPPLVSSDGSISAFKSGDTSAIRALETIVEPGTVIDGFEVGRMIGRGGIAAVYEGVQLETGRDVALKVLDARFSGSREVVSRFLAEGENLSLFDHPNIVKYVGRGRDEDFVYIAMEHVKGINLDQLIYAIPLETRHYLHLANELSKGLTRIHAEGMIHGDVKPSNILVTRPGAVKISDFGTAARMSAAGTARGAGNKVHGTSSFMAPELFDRNQKVDYRADIFSLGVTFYKVLTGKLPAEAWMPPSQVNTTLPAEVDDVIHRALREKPDDRFITVKEFCDAIAAAFEGTPVTSVPRSQQQTLTPSAVPEQKTPVNKKHSDSVDWKLVLLCGLAIIGLAAVIIAVIVYNNLYA